MASVTYCKRGIPHIATALTSPLASLFPPCLFSNFLLFSFSFSFLSLSPAAPFPLSPQSNPQLVEHHTTAVPLFVRCSVPMLVFSTTPCKNVPSHFQMLFARKRDLIAARHGSVAQRSNASVTAFSAEHLTPVALRTTVLVILSIICADRS